MAWTLKSPRDFPRYFYEDMNDTSWEGEAFRQPVQGVEVYQERFRHFCYCARQQPTDWPEVTKLLETYRFRTRAVRIDGVWWVRMTAARHVTDLLPSPRSLPSRI